MVAHDGGSRNLAAVQDNLFAVQAVGFSPEQVVQMVSHKGGSRNLAAVQENLSALQAVGFTAKEVVQVS